MIQVCQARNRHNTGVWCKFHNDFVCSPISKTLWNKIDIPPNACHIHNCDQCIITNRTFIIDKNFALIEPQDFILHEIKTDKDTLSTVYTCLNKQGLPCDCGENGCIGATDFCRIRNCTSNSDCKCVFTYNKIQLTAIMAEDSIHDPDIVILKVCFFDKKVEPLRRAKRRLLEGEKAVFSNKNLNITFEDPILFFPNQGRVILRSADFENVLTIPTDKMVIIPFEYLAYKNEIQVIYIHPNGHTVSGIIHVNGKSVCQIRQCFLCKEVFKHFQCYPLIIKITLYTVTLIFISLVIASLKFIMKTLKFIIQSSILFIWGILRIMKAIVRCSLLLGTLIGNTFREIAHQGNQILERQAAMRGHINILPVVILMIICNISVIHADCNTHAIIKSDLRSCTTLHDGTRTCKIFSTAEFSLQTISAETCLWFTDGKDNHLFSLKVKLEAVLCTFQKQRLYFTFPVKSKQISQISCIYNRFCGKGVHCKKNKLGKEGLRFEAETAESREFPGISSCLPGIASGCALLHRASCNFFRVWYEPDLLNSYEVSQIKSHTCQYQISVEHVENNTVSRILVTDSAITDHGIKITILGAYDQHQIHLQEKLVQRVARPSQAFLIPASDRNFPKANTIGAVQANSSFTTDFIFDPRISTCDYFEDNLRCVHAPDPITRMQSTDEYALPLQRDIHLFKINEDKLQSTLLLSSAVRIQLHFSNFKLALHMSNVCPQIADNSIITSGCYRCPILARMSFRAHSSCQPGVVSVHFQQTSVHTKAIFLNTETETLTIRFHAEQKCVSEKLCLKSATLMQCKTFRMCLDEPSVELLQLNLNYTQIQSAQTSSSAWDWLKIPNVHTPLYLLKILGSSLFIICLIITTMATIITCCCKSR